MHATVRARFEARGLLIPARLPDLGDVDHARTPDGCACGHPGCPGVA